MGRSPGAGLAGARDPGARESTHPPAVGGCPGNGLGLGRAEMGDKCLETGLEEENCPKWGMTRLGLS